MVTNDSDVELPRRVVDVENPSLPRLIEPKGQKGRYVALSHYWGTPKRCPLRTTSRNFKLHCAGIPLEHLSQTFRDAIAVTRSIGLRYLWIDSICIIQDDVSDWEAELDLIGAIFEHAYLTISASTCDPESDGLFLQYKSPLSLLELPFKDSRGDENGSLFVGSKRSLTPNLFNSILSKRGWATQEWILSRRMVHYTEEGMVWACKQATCTEIGMEPVAHFLTPDWIDITWRHSTCRLTFEKDRLASLQGIAAQLQSTRSDQYIQGLWTGELSSQLAWRAVRELKPNCDLPDAPSWTWASKLGGIDSHKYEPYD